MNSPMETLLFLYRSVFFSDPKKKGASIVEVAATVTTVAALVLLRHSVMSKGRHDSVGSSEAQSGKACNAVHSCRSWSLYMITLTKDFTLIIVPSLLFITVLAEWIRIFTFFLSLILFFLIRIKRSDTIEKGLLTTDSVRMNVSSYRVIVMILTYLSILAVDFKIFPRKYSKTTYGTSLMDLGVGSFILANAFVSRQARDVSTMTWKSAIMTISAWVVLGLIRLVVTGGLTHPRVGEYGVHWNFFFTLAGVTFLSSIIYIRPRYCGILGLIVVVGYQTCLLYGLNTYILSDARTNIFSKNKEGIFPVIGFWGMYLIGVQLGNYLFHHENGSIVKMRNSRWTRIRVCILCALFWLLTLILENYVEQVSRKMCNLAYVTFVFAINFQGLATLMLSDLIPRRKASVLEKAIDYNLLGVFLVANLLTGLVNFSVDTYSVSSVTAVIILLSYAFVVCIAAGIAKRLGLKLKVW